MSSVTQYLEEHQIEYTVFDHAQSFTSLQEARALGVDPHEVVKALVLDTKSGHAIAVIPSTRMLDMKLARKAVDDPHATLATEGEIADDFPGYDLGAVPPFSELIDAPVYVDPEVAMHDWITIAAGSQTESVMIPCADFLSERNTSVVPLVRRARSFDDGVLS